MNNLRKMKKKKKIKPANPQQIAKQKLFQISHYEEDPFNDYESEMINIKLQANPISDTSQLIQTSKYNPSFTSQNKCQRDHKKIQNPLKCTNSNFYNKKNLTETSYVDFKSYKQSKSTELRQKTPINLIRYILVDNRDNKNSKRHEKAYSLINLKKKMQNKIQNPLRQQYTTEIDIHQLPHKTQQKETLRDISPNFRQTRHKIKHLKRIQVLNFNKSGLHSPFEIKNIKLVNKYFSNIS